MDYEKMPLIELGKKCEKGDEKALREWKARWENDFPKMGL